MADSPSKLRYHPRPPPLRVHRSPSRPTTPLSPTFSPEKLLYDLPPSTSLRSPPPSASKTLRSRSPPSSGTRHTSLGSPYSTRQDANGNMSVPPSPKHRNAPVGNSEPRQVDLDAFAEICRRWYYEQHATSGRLMSQSLASVNPSHRATYTRLQASIRSAFHANQSMRRITELRAILSSTQSGNSLTPFARANPSSPVARKERLDKLSQFIERHCIAGVPGTHPFFEGLYGILRLESLPQNLGGAGHRRVIWEIDDAVFLESAGKDFTMEAIDVLKGVLAFEESLADFSTSNGQLQSIVEDHSEDERDEIANHPLTSTRLRQISPSNSFSQEGNDTRSPQSLDSRGRTTSDPFIDPTRSLGSNLGLVTSLSDTHSAEFDSPPLSAGRGRPQNRPNLEGQQYLAEIDEQSLLQPQLRVWTFPVLLGNPEISRLTALFPPFITQRSLTRFPVVPLVSTTPTSRELEDGVTATSMMPPEVCLGTGRMRVSEQTRADGWQGTLWERVIEWLRRLFG